MRVRLFVRLALLSAGLLGTLPAVAQITTATLFGIVTDPAGAVVPGTTIALTHDATGTTITKTADSAGEFAFDFLRVGAYTLGIKAPGFKVYESKGIELAAAQSVRRSFALELGAVTETVHVTSDALQVNTVGSEQRESFNRLEITQLPISQRSFDRILGIATGVSTSDGNGGVRLNGLGRSGLKITTDGIEATSNPENPGTSLKQNFNAIHVMSLEAIQEVQSVLSAGLRSARFGIMVWEGQVP